MKYLRTFLLVGAALTLAKDKSKGLNMLHEGADRINEQINYIEEIITMYPTHYVNNTLVIGGVEMPENMTEDEVRGLQKCIARIRNEVNKDLIKHNALMRRLIKSYSFGGAYEEQDDLEKDYVRYLMENKFLYLTAIPAYLKKIFTRLNLTIGETEMKEAEKMLEWEQIKGTEQILNISKIFELDEIPF